MKVFTLAILVTILSGCVNKTPPSAEPKPLPYQIVKKQHPQGKRVRFNEYSVGVTQEKITARNYVITAKLDKPNTLAQAKEMALYYGALLAKQHGARKFSIGNRGQSYWCKSSPPNKSGNKTSTLGGPAFQFHLEFISLSQSKKTPLLIMNTNKTIKALASKVYNKPSETAWAQVVKTQPKRCKNRTRYQNFF